jgi:hypothetical protein
MVIALSAGNMRTAWAVEVLRALVVVEVLATKEVP